MQPELIPDDLLAQAGRQWALELVRWRSDLPLAGSPERSLWRRVAEAADGRRFVLEKIASRDFGRKRRIQQSLHHLQRCGLGAIAPYRTDREGDGIALMAHGLWQLSPFVDGVALERPAYVMDGWRGEATARFLIDLATASRTQPLPCRLAAFSLADYVHNLFAQVARYAPETAEIYRPFYDHLKTHLFGRLESLPIGFCHGDYHPLNIIWGQGEMRAVIDWEFCGIKPEIYDLANLLGCLGMEDPACLGGPLVKTLVGVLREAGQFAPTSWRLLPEVMLAIRFAWLSEWMRKKDRPMIRMEADYMALLLDHRLELKQLGA